MLKLHIFTKCVIQLCTLIRIKFCALIRINKYASTFQLPHQIIFFNLINVYCQLDSQISSKPNALFDRVTTPYCCYRVNSVRLCSSIKTVYAWTQARFAAFVRKYIYMYVLRWLIRLNTAVLCFLYSSNTARCSDSINQLILFS